MRIAFFLLLFANLVLYAWAQGYLGGRGEGREPERLVRQLQPERLRVVNTDALPAPVAVAGAAGGAACKRIEGLAAAEAETLRNRVTEVPGWDASVVPLKQAPVYWIVVPELASRAAAEKKRTELRQLGVNEGQIVENSSFGPFAISLGIFRNQQGAEEFMQATTRKNVRSARMVQREMPADRVAVELRAPAEDLVRKLPDLLSLLPQAGLADCDSR